MSHLPTELIHEIILYLGVTDRSTCLMVCRRWYNLFQPLLYNHVIFESSTRFHQFLKTLTLSPVHGPCVHVLEIRNSIAVSRVHFDILTAACPQMRSIDFWYQHWHAIDQSGLERWVHISRLPVINYQRVLSWLESHPTLQHLDLAAECFERAAGIVARAPSLRHLVLRSHPSSTDVRRDTTSLIDKPLGLTPILDAAKGRLESLALKGRILITDNVVHFPPLVELSMLAVVFAGTPYFDMTRMRTLTAYGVTSVAEEEGLRVIQEPRRDGAASPLLGLRSLSIDHESINCMKPILVQADAQHLRKLSVSNNVTRKPQSRGNWCARQVIKPPDNIEWTTYGAVHALVSNHDVTPALQFIGHNLTWLELTDVTIRFRELVCDKRLQHLRHLLLSSGRMIVDTDIDKAAASQQPFRRLASIKLRSVTIPDLKSIAQWTHRLVLERCTHYVAEDSIGITLSDHWLAYLDISHLLISYGIHDEPRLCKLFGIIDNNKCNDPAAARTSFFHACNDNGTLRTTVHRVPDAQAALVPMADSARRTHKGHTHPFHELCSKCGGHFGYIAVQRNNPRLECRFEGKAIALPLP